MKFEKLNHFRHTTLKWGLLPSVSTTSTQFENLAELTATEFQEKYLLPPVNPSIKVEFKYSKEIEAFPTVYENSSPLIYDKYGVLRYSSFISFFDNRNIDVPRCFKKTSSLRRLNFELLFLKLSNYLMHQGKKEKSFVIVASIMSSLFKMHKKSASYVYGIDFNNWNFLYFAFNSIILAKQENLNFSFIRYGTTTNSHFFKQNIKYHSSLSTLQLLTVKYLLFLQPLFRFVLFNLDKKSKKSKRGKSSKYLFIWKYVPSYKRRALLLKLIVSDVKFNSGKTLKTRLFNSIETLYKTPEKSYVFQVNNFSHNYVFKNLRRSLLVNFKTTA